MDTNNTVVVPLLNFSGVFQPADTIERCGCFAESHSCRTGLSPLAMAKVTTEAARSLFKALTNGSNFDRVLRKVTLTAIATNRVSCEMKVEEEHVNRSGTLHGGLTSTLVDTISTIAIMANERGEPGVSTELSVSYLRAPKLGETVRIDAECLKVGRTLAFAKVDIRRLSDDALVAVGKHTKFVG